MRPTISTWPAQAVIGLCLLPGWAQAQTPRQEAESPEFPLLTNVAQLCQFAPDERRALCSLQLEGVVCSADAASGRFILQDDSGAELFEMDLSGSGVSTPQLVTSSPTGLGMDVPGAAISAGDRIRLEQRNCAVTFTGLGVTIGKGPVVDNDGIHPMLGRSGRIYLGTGRHPLRLLWFNAYGQYGLGVSLQGPGVEHQTIPDSFLFRTEIDPASGRTNSMSGLDYRCYEGRWMNLSSDFGHSRPVRSGHVRDFDLGVRTRDQWVGLEFSGSIETPREGWYTFETESDDGSLLFIGEPPPSLERLGASPPPVPRPLMVSQALPEAAAQWIEVEGTVAFASETDAGLVLELRAETGRMEVAVADGSGLSPTRLLHQRIRVAGVGQSVQSLDGSRVLGLVATLGGADISPVEAAPGGTKALPLLTTGEQVKRLTREEARRGYQVRVRGVVTRAVRGYNTMVVQDATRGVFVRGLLPQNAEAPQLGEFWEIEGTTAPGDFAPVINWRAGRRLGTGRLPEPVAATWDQLMSGSLDTQYVEIEGVATAVGTNRMELLLPEGKIALGFLDWEPGGLDRFENALIRVRGCLFPAWNQQTHRLHVGEMNISSAIISVEEAGPPDLFSTPAKQASELFLYNAGAGAFQRVKVIGQFLGTRQGQCFMNDGTIGLRFQPRAAPGLQPGDCIEVVGYPELGGPSPLLREAVARKTGHAELPQPRTLPPENWLDAGHDATLVRVDGLLVGLGIEGAEHVLELQSGLRTFVARLSPNERLPGSLPPGSRVRLTGVYAAQSGGRAPERGGGSFELLLNSAADIQVLARPPWVTLPRVLGALAAVATILVGAMFWALSLRRRVSAQTAIIREKAQREVALEERARIAKDIHDDVGSNLTYIMMLGERSREDLARPRELAAHTDKIVAYARATIQALDEIVWAINPQNDTLDALVGYVNQYASQFFENTSVRCRLDVPERLSSLVLRAEIRHDLFLVVKEALNNVLKHAQASEVNLALTESGGLLEIAIEDNGRGFEAGQCGASKRGDGLKNMRKRMAKIAGDFLLASVPGQGTKLKLTIRL